MYTIFDPVMLGLKTPYEEIIPLVAKHGIGGVAISPEMLDDGGRAIEADKMMKDYGLKWGTLPVAEDFYAKQVDDALFEKGLDRLKRWCDICGRIGLTRSYNHIWSGSDTREFDENFEWHVRRMEKVHQVLKDHEMFYGLEFLGPKPIRDSYKHLFVHTIAGVLAIAGAVSREIGFLFDVYHWYCGSGRWDDVYFAAQNTDRMLCIHLDDGIAGVARDAQQDFVRAMPMTTGVIDAKKIVGLFAQNGYDGPVLCEPLGDPVRRLAAMPLEQAVGEVAAAYTRTLAV